MVGSIGRLSDKGLVVEFLTLLRVFSAIFSYLLRFMFAIYFKNSSFEYQSSLDKRHDLPGCVIPPLPPSGVVLTQVILTLPPSGIIPTYRTDLLSLSRNIVNIDYNSLTTRYHTMITPS